MKTQKIIGIVVLLVALGFIPTSCAYACSCVPAPNPREAFDKAGAVFAGKVVDIQKPLFARSSLEPMTVVFDVSLTWKGQSNKKLFLYTPAGGEASCGFEFEQGKEYLIYASNSEELLYVSLCSRTKLLKDAQDDLKIFGAGEIPFGQSQPGRGVTPGLKELTLGIVLVGIIGVLYKFIPKYE